PYPSPFPYTTLFRSFPVTNFPANGQYTLRVQGFDNKNGAISNDTASVTFTIQAQQTTSLSVSSASGSYGATVDLSATLSAGGSGVGGKTVNFSLNGGSSVGTATTNSSGVATLSNVSLGSIG